MRGIFSDSRMSDKTDIMSRRFHVWLKEGSSIDVDAYSHHWYLVKL